LKTGESISQEIPVSMQAKEGEESECPVVMMGIQI
jgi:hypothetical protein